jgi:hypothetical protein
MTFLCAVGRSFRALLHFPCQMDSPTISIPFYIFPSEMKIFIVIAIIDEIFVAVLNSRCV